MATLIVFAGLPGVGKSSIARELARKIGAVWLRIDSIEQAIKASGVTFVDNAGYLVAQAIAEENLRLGHDVIADRRARWGADHRS
jgi:predicted kinase